MRVAAICQSAVAGGAERYLVSLYAALGELGVDGTLVGSVPGWADAGLPNHDVALGPKWAGLRSAPQAIRLPQELRRVRAAVEDLDADVVHVQFDREKVGFTGPLSADRPVVWTEHGLLGDSRTSLLPRALRHAARSASLVLCVSPSVAVDLERFLGRVSAPVVVVPNAVDTRALVPADEGERAAARAALGVPADGPVLAWVGRTDASKLPLWAVRVGRAFSGTTVIAGSGSEDAAVSAAADGTTVRFLGRRDDPRTVYAAADAFLFSSTGAFEGMPLAILEAAACGLPVFTNTESGMTDLAEATGGGAEPLDRAEQLAARIAAGVRRSDAETTARAWAVEHDVRPWARRHADLFAAVMR